MTARRCGGWIIAALLFAATPAAGQISARDRQVGAEAKQQLLAEFGGAYEGKAAAYVRQVGKRIASQSGQSANPNDYTVTLLNSSVTNAMALPGGYVYVTRQLLALMNNEAELASVMGHEVGHVAGRHAQKRQQRSALSGIGAAILGAVTGSAMLGQLAGQGAQLYTLSYSRDQEREADALGVRYLAKAGYDPWAASTMLQQLGAQTSLDNKLRSQEGEGQRPSWLNTHPLTEERVQLTRKDAKQVTPAPGRGDLGRDRLLDAIDGMTYDDDPEQGIVDGRTFRHGGLRLEFIVPPGFVMSNSPQAVIAQGPGGARLMFGGGQLRQGEGLDDYIARIWQAIGARGAPPAQPFRTRDFYGAESATRAQTQSGVVDATVTAFQAGNGSVYHFVTLAPAGRDPGFDAMLQAFRRMTPAEAASVKPRIVRVVTVKPGDSVASLSARMAYADDRQGRFMVLNGMTSPRQLVPGERVKLIVFGS